VIGAGGNFDERRDVVVGIDGKGSHSDTMDRSV
jgi:hypothetical protein